LEQKKKENMSDKKTPEFWRDIKPGSTITLSDEQSIQESMSRGLGVGGLDFVVDSVLRIRHDDGLAEWYFYNLGDEHQEIYLVTKLVGQHIDVGVYFEPDEFPPGNRRDLVMRGDTWIFEEPEDVEDFLFDELKYNHELIMSLDVNNTGSQKEEDLVDVYFGMKNQGVQYGSAFNVPDHSGMGRIMASVVEYSTDTAYENPTVMILELGGDKSEDGGLISMLSGCPINLSEVDVLKSQIEKPVQRKKPTLWEKIVKRAAQ